MWEKGPVKCYTTVCSVPPDFGVSTLLKEEGCGFLKSVLMHSKNAVEIYK